MFNKVAEQVMKLFLIVTFVGGFLIGGIVGIVIGGLYL
jgi:hypothetical protein